MRARWFLLLATSASALALVAAATRTPPEPVYRPAEATTTPNIVRARAIAFYQQRVARDTFSARDFVELGRLYLERSRETGNAADVERAERYARRSLHLRTTRNTPAFFTLAASLLSEHRFLEAREAAEQLVQLDSSSTAARALLGEIDLELGRYADADRTFGALRTYQADLSVAPRLARWEEIRGRPEEARRLLLIARDAAEGRHAMPREQRAWMHLRLGELALRYRHLREARRELQAGLAIAGDDYRLLGAMARLEAARGKWQSAIDYGSRAIAIALDPATLGVLSEASAASGDTAKAGEYARAMEVAVLRQPGPFHRAWSLFLLDHGQATDTVLARAREELAARRDIYGYDLLAWAQHKRGLDGDAKATIDHALAVGTRDPLILDHAAAIDAALANAGRKP
jgi:tetratricopeptide (TPR) repeat protein